MRFPQIEARHQIPRDSDRLLVIFSDIEMGAGGVTDDFPRTDFLAELILSYNSERYARCSVDLVFNGDTFDFLKTPVDGAYPSHITPAIAVAKLDAVAAAHADFFEALRDFVAFEWPKRRIHFIVGNHDCELLFPELQRALARRIGADERLFFPGLELEVGDVHIEHGMQVDEMFKIDAERPFFERDGQRLLNLSWGALALLEVAVPLYPKLYHLDRVRPGSALFAALPEAKELLLSRSWRYWTREYVQKFFADDDPMRRITWRMIKEIVYRFASVDTDVAASEEYTNELRASETQRVYVVGHRHDPGLWGFGDRRMLRTGCFRDEYILRDGGAKQIQLPKSYVEVFLDGDRHRHAGLVEIEGPPPPEGHLPSSVLDFGPVLKQLLAEQEGHDEANAQLRAHEANEDTEAD